jgi:hypothetical protein
MFFCLGKICSFDPIWCSYGLGINTPPLLTDRENAPVTLDLIFRHTTLLQNMIHNIGQVDLIAHWHNITPILQNPNFTPAQLNQALRYYVDNTILHVIRQPQQNDTHATIINGHQSTHTASVHTTTDLTAWLLLEQHKKEIEASINLRGLWPVIQKKFSARKSQIEQKIQKLESLQTDLTEAQKKELINTRNTLKDFFNTQAHMETANDCLNRLANVSYDIILTQHQKQTALAYLNEYNLTNDPIIHIQVHEPEHL